MADKAISQLPAASQITPTDLLVLEQAGEAKHVTGQTLESWLLSFADGHGGVQTIKKTGTSGLEDTYSIVMADGSSFEYIVTNGKKGDPAKLVSSAVHYQVSESGTEVPTGTWSTEIATSDRGQYLWTRVTLQFDSGEPVTAYMVSRAGVDGMGAVVSICGVGPDSETGDVPLTADHVGALPTGGGKMTGNIAMSGNKVTGLGAPTADSDAATKEYADTKTKFVRLWQNSNPSSTFAPQELTIPGLSEYPMYCVVCCYGNNSENNRNVTASNIAPVGKGCKVILVGITQFCARSFNNYGGDELTVQEGYYATVENNAYCIPLEVYGVTGVET